VWFWNHNHVCFHWPNHCLENKSLSLFIFRHNYLGDNKYSLLLNLSFLFVLGFILLKFHCWLCRFLFSHLLTYLLTYLLTPWCRVLLEKLTGLKLVKKFPAFHGTRRFITALTSVHHLSLSCAIPIQSIHPHPTSWRYSLILSTHLRLGLPIGLFPSGFPTKTVYTPLSSPNHATFPFHFILLDFIAHTILGEEYKSLSSLLCNLIFSVTLITNLTTLLQDLLFVTLTDIEGTVS